MLVFFKIGSITLIKSTFNNINWQQLFQNSSFQNNFSQNPRLQIISPRSNINLMIGIFWISGFCQKLIWANWDFCLVGLSGLGICKLTFRRSGMTSSSMNSLKMGICKTTKRIDCSKWEVLCSTILSLYFNRISCSILDIYFCFLLILFFFYRYFFVLLLVM